MNKLITIALIVLSINTYAQSNKTKAKQSYNDAITTILTGSAVGATAIVAGSLLIAPQVVIVGCGVLLAAKVGTVIYLIKGNVYYHKK